jgi:hypothetical protein
LHSCLPTLASGHPHRVLYDRTDLPGTHASHFTQKLSHRCRLPLFICHPERSEALTPCSFSLSSRAHSWKSGRSKPRKRFPLCERAAFVEERPFRAASERLSERGFSPGDKQSLGFLRGPSPLIICHPEGRAKKRSARARVEGPLHSCLPTLASGHPHRVLYDRTDLPGTHASHFTQKLSLLPPTLFICHTERESKDLCTLAFQRWHQGILTVPSMIELLAVCKRRGTCCRLPYLFVILSASRRTLPLLFFLPSRAHSCNTGRSKPRNNCLFVEERPFRAAKQPSKQGLLSPVNRYPVTIRLCRTTYCATDPSFPSSTAPLT